MLRRIPLQPLHQPTLDTQRGLGVSIRQDAPMDNPHTASLAKVTLDRVARIGGTCPEAEAGPDLVGERPHAFGREDG